MDLGSDEVAVAWTNSFFEPEASSRRSEIQRRRHANDPEFHERSLEILKRSREARFWSEERILDAIRDFQSKNAGPPSYYDFRRAKDLPDYSTVRKRFGSLKVAISRSFES
ncbi:MAG: homing endonuclease associated repeat-containing protein [Acidimicrobiia bacterium]